VKFVKLKVGDKMWKNMKLQQWNVMLNQIKTNIPKKVMLNKKLSCY